MTTGVPTPTEGAIDSNPYIVLVSGLHGEVLHDEFRRYVRDYELVVTESAASALDLVEQLAVEGRQIALFVVDFELPDSTGLDTVTELRTVVPTARRLLIAHRERFLEAQPTVRPAMASGLLDALLILPQGARDEEFHTAVTEMLSEWASTVAKPEVEIVKIVATGAEPLTLQIRDLLSRVGMPHGVHEPDSPTGAQILADYHERHGRLDDLPIVRVAIRDLLIAPQSSAEIASHLSTNPADFEASSVADLLIVGGGPAGLAAAVYGASEGLSTIVVEADAVGGQAGTSSMIRNYLGFPRGISGMRLAQRASQQALRFGATFFNGTEVLGLSPVAPSPGEPTPGEPSLDEPSLDEPSAIAPTQVWRVSTDRGEITARSVVLASGVAYRRLGVPSVEAFAGRGVHYGSAMTAAREMEGADVIVVGGGNSAGQAALHLAKFAREVTIMVRRDGLEATMSQYLIDEISHNGRIRVQPSSTIVGGGGSGWLEYVEIAYVGASRRGHDGVALDHVVVDEAVPGEGSNPDAGVTRREVQGVFLLLGAVTHTGWLPEQICRDENGYVLTGRDVPQEFWTDGLPPANRATNMPGVFAVGDVRAGSMKRVASATGEGASVVPLVHQWLGG